MKKLLQQIFEFLTKTSYNNDFEVYLQSQNVKNTADLERLVFDYVYQRKGGL